jgi:hypothetical protein
VSKFEASRTVQPLQFRDSAGIAVPHSCPKRARPASRNYAGFGLPTARNPCDKRLLRVDSRQASLPPARPVTPEVAGSSPVAPVKSLQIGIFCCPSDANDRRLSSIPRTSRTGIAADAIRRLMSKVTSDISTACATTGPESRRGRQLLSTYQRPRGRRGRPTEEAR